MKGSENHLAAAIVSCLPNIRRSDENTEGANHRIRRNFGKIGKTIDIPNLIEVQKQSYERFLQKEMSHLKSERRLVFRAFKSVFPIRDFSGSSSLNL